MAAWSFLKKSGYKILERNFSCAIGEIDVIAERNNRLAFIEIKSRKGNRYGLPQESVHKQKQKKITLVAQYYRKMNNLTDCSASFDVVAVTWSETGPLEFRLIQDAFSLEAEL